MVIKNINSGEWYSYHNKLGKDYQTRATQCANITDLRSDQEHPINNRKYS